MILTARVGHDGWASETPAQANVVSNAPMMGKTLRGCGICLSHLLLLDSLIRSECQVTKARPVFIAHSWATPTVLEEHLTGYADRLLQIGNKLLYGFDHCRWGLIKSLDQLLQTGRRLISHIQLQLVRLLQHFLIF